MTQRERRVYLIRALQDEMPQYRGAALPDDATEQKRMLRSLMNVRPPIKAPEEFLNVQDAYLSEEISRRGITESASLPPTAADSRIFLWKGDITGLKAGAIVNAANGALLGCWQPCHSCIDNIIHSYAGVQLRIACNDIMQAQGHEEPAGGAKITPAFNLPCQYVLHTVGPIISGPLRDEDCALLESCYQSCLDLAVKNQIRSIAFCCISTGVFHFPQDKAAEIAVKAAAQSLELHPSIEQVIFDVYTDKDFGIYQRLLGDAFNPPERVFKL